jgi:hypothetical protein
VPELERRLRELPLDWPPQPELTLAVRAAIAQPPGQRPARRALVLALAALVLALAAAFAVPQARTAILRWFGLEHVRVVRVEHLPPTRRLEPSDLGRRTSFVGATREAGFELLVPRKEADAVYLASAGTGERVTLVYGSVERPRLLISEFRGVGVTDFFEKLVTSGTRVERVQVGGSPGLWLSGAPHAVYFGDPARPDLIHADEPRLAGNTLVWERPGSLTVRIEGELDKDQALALAESLR